MDVLKFVLFESPIALLIPCALVLFFLLVRWRQGRSARPLLIGLAVTGALWLMQSLVVTHREAGSAVLREIETELLGGRLGALDRSVALDFQSQGLDRDEFLDFAHAQLNRVTIHWLQRLSTRVEWSQENRFALSVRYLSDVTRDDFRSSFRTGWRIIFDRRDGGWKIVNIEPVEIPGVNSNQWRNIGR